MPYYDNFSHIGAHENITSPACLIVFVKSKTENQLIGFIIAYLAADNKVKCETVGAITSDIWPPTVLALILWITGYVEYCSNVFIGNLLKTER